MHITLRIDVLDRDMTPAEIVTALTQLKESTDGERLRVWNAEWLDERDLITCYWQP